MPDTSKTGWNTNDTGPHEWDKSHTSETRPKWTTQVLNEYYTNDTSAARVKNFDFDNDTTENIFFDTPVLAMYQIKDYDERNNFILRTICKCLVSMTKCVWKLHRKKLTFVMAKAISKSYTLDCSSKCPCTFPHS